MASEAVSILTQLSVILLAGILASALAYKLKISNVLALLLVGLGLGLGTDIFTFNSTLTVALGITALAMVVFEGTSKFSLRQLDSYSVPALELTGYALVLTALFVGVIAYFTLFSHISGGVLFALVLALALAGTDPSSVILLLPNENSKLSRLLTIEAIINTPIVVLLPFIALDALTDTFALTHLVDIIQQLIVGVGAGVVIGLILFKVMRKSYAKDLSTVGIVAGALITYLAAENLGGSGVLAVATLGIIFGNVRIKHKDELTDFSFALSSILEILVFILIGILVGNTLALDPWIFLTALLIFAGLLAARFIAAQIALREEYEFTDRLIVSLLMPKGIAAAVLLFIFSSPLYPFVPESLSTTLFVVMLYSILAATITSYWWAKNQK